MTNAKKKLLIVDDQMETRTLLSAVFTSIGHDVVCASDGFSALKRIRHTVPDVILSDLNMPGMSGFEFLSVVRRRLPRIYVVASSGAYTGDAIPEGIAADAFYEKATGLKNLFELMEVAADSAPRTDRGDDASPAVWIAMDDWRAAAGNNSRDNREPRLMLACPECLRNSPCAAGDRPNVVYDVECIYCGTRFQYALVESLDALPEMNYHAELSAAVNM